MICDVCGERESVDVVCSRAGPVSFAYCRECLDSGREPYSAIVASLVGMNPMGIADWYKPTIAATIKAEGKTVEQLFEDVREAEEEYAAVHIR